MAYVLHLYEKGTSGLVHGMLGACTGKAYLKQYPGRDI